MKTEVNDGPICITCKKNTTTTFKSKPYDHFKSHSVKIYKLSKQIPIVTISNYDDLIKEMINNNNCFAKFMNNDDVIKKYNEYVITKLNLDDEDKKLIFENNIFHKFNESTGHSKDDTDKYLNNIKNLQNNINTTIKNSQFKCRGIENYHEGYLHFQESKDLSPLINDSKLCTEWTDL